MHLSLYFIVHRLYSLRKIYNDNEDDIMNVVWFTIFVVLFFAPFFYVYEDGCLSHRELAYPDSNFVKIDGLEIHYKIYGSQEKYMVLLHGFGSSTYTWHKIVGKLSESYTVISYDRPGFGLTERRFDLKYNPYTNEYQVELLKKLLEHLGIAKATIVGHSAGGFIAMKFALTYPQMVERIVLVDPAILTRGGVSDFLKIFFKIPQVNHVGPDVIARLITRSYGENLSQIYYDTSKLSEEDREAYLRPTRVLGWKKAFWEFVKSSEYEDITPLLPKLDKEVLIIHGEEDRVIPLQEIQELAKKLKNAKVCLIENCGHIPQEECPEQFLECLID